ncbi:MAG: O-antigen ligase family protein [Planctomycetota bacterium]
MPAINGSARVMRGMRDSMTGFVVAFSIWAFTLINFTAPGRRGAEGSEGIDVITLLKMGSRGIAILLMLTILLRDPPSRILRELRHHFLPMLLFVLWGLVSFAWSAKAALTIAQAGCMGALILLAFLIARHCRDRFDISFVMQHLTMSLAFVSVIVLAVQIVRPEWSSVTRNAAGEGANGIMHPTTIGSTSALALVLLLPCQFLWRFSWQQKWFWPLLITHSIALYLSAARLALVLTVLVLFGLLLISIPRKHILAAALILGTLGTALLTVNPDLRLVGNAGGGVTEYLQRGQSAAEMGSLTGRGELWPVMWKSFMESPIRGHGYYVTTARGEVRVWGQPTNLTAHNVLLHSLCTVGIIGTLFLLWSILSVSIAFLRRPYVSEDDKTLRWVSLAMVVWFSGWGLLNASFLAPFQPESVVFFIFVGLAIAHCNVNRERNLGV